MVHDELLHDVPLLLHDVVLNGRFPGTQLLSPGPPAG